jgi:diketogulonate reductase-like aldo/keto reductase
MAAPLVPSFLYGTAWKEEATEELAYAALTAGFRGLDTANQRKHYDEAAVGRAIGRKLAEGLPRDTLFVQSKFTYRAGQDERLPYDPAAPLTVQVAQSFASSLTHLGLDTLDSLVLHGPSQRDGLGADDREVWAAMEQLVDAGRVRYLGISNASAEQVEELVGFARVAPSFVQNRCYAARGWDAAVRAVCAAHGVRYQGFSLLTANGAVGGDPKVRAIARRHRKTPAEVIFRFAQQVGMIPLTGTSRPERMRLDLAVESFTLDASELAVLQDAGRR